MRGKVRKFEKDLAKHNYLGGGSSDGHPQKYGQAKSTRPALKQSELLLEKGRETKKSKITCFSRLMTDSWYLASCYSHREVRLCQLYMWRRNILNNNTALMSFFNFHNYLAAHMMGTSLPLSARSKSLSLSLIRFSPLGFGFVMLAGAQTPDISGTWVSHQTELQLYEVEATEAGPATTAFDRLASDSSTFEIGADNTAMIGDESAYFVFDNGFMVPIATDNPTALGLSEEIDTIIRSTVEDVPLEISLFRRFEFEVGIRRPAGVFTVNSLAGRWISLRQTLITLQSPELRDEVFVGAYQEVDQINLAPDGTFSFTNLSATSSSQTAAPFNGTWQPAGTGLTLNVAGQTLALRDISAGGDTSVQLETEVFDNGGSQNFDQSFTILIKETPVLEPSDVIGAWAFSTQHLNSYGDSDNFDQQFLGNRYEFGRIELLPDGRITGVVLASSEPVSSPSAMTWSIQGNQLRIDEEGQPPILLRVSAGLDFAAGLSFEEKPFYQIDIEQEYGIVTACKLPETASLFPYGTTIAADGMVTLCSGTQAGVFYQLERSSNLLEWTAVGPPVEGTGAEICTEDPLFQSGSALYRWRVVTPPEP